MEESISSLEDWLDQDFFDQGAYLTNFELDQVVLAKGGEIIEASSFTPSSKPSFYLKDFFEEKFLVYQPASLKTVPKKLLEETLAHMGSVRPQIKNTITTDDLYRKDFEELSQSFTEGLQKVVLISREEYSVTNFSDLKQHLLKKSFEFGTGMPYGLWFKDYGMMGSTPELLFETHGPILKTFALAGTAKLGEEAQLLSSPKDRKEHDLVIRDITEKLSPFCDDITHGETYILPYKTIVHLKTDITATKKKDVDLCALTNLLSPTAALGGYPKTESLRFLRNSNYQKLHPERYFGSAFGLVMEDHEQFIVAIRNIQWKDERVYIESGGGVISSSDLKKELEEIHLKRKTIKKHYL